MSDDPPILNARQITQVLPHRYPFLLIDRVTAFDSGKSITALKNVSINEPFFQGHFPGNPVMPGVLVIEAMAQAGGVLSHLTYADLEPKPLFYLVGIDGTRFRRPIVPGDLLQIDIEVEWIKRGMWRYKCRATVDGKLAVAASIMCAPGSEKL
ncbi:MAG: 3-hydroxyacyl-ACP dehydratase FabZ [Gammaproteobacteria bacterium]|nr:3-hydroxyacyl-ACP dehydratase FabZ [Gammaproteobacteria bacterium]